MKTVTQTTDDQDTDNSFALEMRQRAKKIFVQIFDVSATLNYQRIEWVTQQIVITDEDGFVEADIAEQTANLGEARKMAKEAYGDDSPEATFAMYTGVFGQTVDEKLFDLYELTLELTERVTKRK